MLLRTTPILGRAFGIALLAALLGCGASSPPGGQTPAAETRAAHSGWNGLAQTATWENPLLAASGKTHQAPHHAWQAVDGVFWQIVAPEREPTAVTDAREGNGGTCPAGMVRVRGEMKLDPPGARLETMQLKTCTAWMNKQFPARCRAFDRNAWLQMTASLPTRPMDFCVDRYEYPNVRGQYPAAFVSAIEASSLCAKQGKRLCDEDEWTFACEGEEAVPYSHPGGYQRDASACITDVEWEAPNEVALEDRDARAAALEMDRLWRGKASGTQPRCKSAFGVFDMVGNVDEWTTARPGSVKAGPQKSTSTILKGGYWGPVRARCRPSTRSHDEHHEYFQQGFRCCAASPSSST